MSKEKISKTQHWPHQDALARITLQKAGFIVNDSRTDINGEPFRDKGVWKMTHPDGRTAEVCCHGHTTTIYAA